MLVALLLVALAYGARRHEPGLDRREDRERELRPGLLADVTHAIAGEGSNIRRIEARVGETREATVNVSLETSDARQLEKIVSRIRAIPGVKDVVRKYNVAKAGERE